MKSVQFYKRERVSVVLEVKRRSMCTIREIVLTGARRNLRGST